MNYICIVGRLIDKPTLERNYETNETKAVATIAVNRNYKSDEGIYETDFFKVLLTNQVADATCEYCQKGDVVGIVGRLENRYNEDKTKYDIIIANKISFISQGKGCENDE